MRDGKRLALGDSIVVVACLVLAVPRWSSYFTDKISLKSAHAYPSLAHPLGADHLGRDLLVRLSQAISEAVIPLWLTVVLASAMGITLGSFASVKVRSPISAIIRRFFDFLGTILAAIPATVTTFVLAAFFEQASVHSVVIAIGAIVCVRNYLQTRDLARQSSRLAYWTAHEALGGTDLSRVWRYGICGNWRNDLLAALGLNLSGAVIIEATLSYLGFGVQEPSPSFGNILSAHFAESLKGQWWVMGVTLCALTVTMAAPRIALLWLQRSVTARESSHQPPATSAQTTMVSAPQRPELSNPQ